LRSETIDQKRKGHSRREVSNVALRDLIHDINENIMPYINANIFDVLGQFYTTFIRYAGSDSKTGLVLTPHHITDFFCDLANLTKDDVVLDPCCGTGGFLVSAMKHMIDKSGNDQSRHRDIKSSQLIGIENRADMFSHACSNMMMRGDGKSNVIFGSCFNTENIREVKQSRPTKVFLNPPYDGDEDRQLEFVENALDCIEIGGCCIAICQMSAAITSKKNAVQFKKRLLEKHTLEAVLSMPDELFHPNAVVTCIMVFRAGEPHLKGRKTFFGYFKDDGHRKVKNKGRIDYRKRWQKIRGKWLSAYTNRETVAGLCLMHEVRAEDEWCAEAYMQTDYSVLDDKDFIDTVRKYVGFQFLQGAN